MENVLQPPSYFSKKHRIIWLQKHACGKLWRQCTLCRKWRFTDAKSVSLSPQDWTCQLNPNASKNPCDEVSAELKVINQPPCLDFSVGDLVVAHIYGYPWWPAVVDFDPFSETYFSMNLKVVEAYHVVFLDSKERAWVKLKDIKLYKPPLKVFSWKFKNELLKASQEAQKAFKMEPYQRLLSYSYTVNMKDWDSP